MEKYIIATTSPLQKYARPKMFKTWGDFYNDEEVQETYWFADVFNEKMEFMYRMESCIDGSWTQETE